MSNDTNRDQIEYWNEVSGPKWVAMQEELDDQLKRLQDALISYLEPEPGQRILDIGCGCGATALMLADIVGVEGSVTGLDVSQPMLSWARTRAEKIELTNITFEEGDAQSYPLSEATYDTVTSRFGIMFFANPTEAFTNFKSSLKADGALTFMCWRPIQDNPWMTVPLMAAAEHLEMPPPPEPNAPGPFAFADRDYLKKLLTDAGFTSIEIVPFDSTMNMGAGSKIDDSVNFVTKIGPLSRLLQDANDETIENAKTSIRKALKPHQTSEGVELDAAVWLVKARA